jgi:hypothetical protein
MTNKRRQDPYRRRPPTIDLASTESSRMDPAGPSPDDAPPAVTAAAGEASSTEPETAIEPVAATGLDGGTGEPSPPPDTIPPAPDNADIPRPAEPSPGAVGGDPANAADAAPDVKAWEEVKLAMAAETGARPDPDSTGGPGETAGGPRPGDTTPAPAGAALAGGVPGDTVGGPAAAAGQAPSALASLGRGRGSDDASASSPPREPVAAPARRGLGSLVAASLLGGLVGAGLAIGADTWLRPSGADAGRRLAALEQRVGAIGERPASPPNAALDGRISALEASARTWNEGLAAARDAAARGAAAGAGSGLDEIRTRLGVLEDTTKRIEAAGAGRGEPGALEALGGRVAALDERVRGAATQAALGELAARLGPLQEGAAQSARNAAALADLRSALETARSEAERRAQAVSGAAAAAEARSSELEKRVAALGEEVGKLPPGLLQAGLRAVVAGEAADALRAGARLGPSLGALGRLGIGAPALDALRPYADTAAPTAAALAAEFKPLAEKIVAEPVGRADTLSDRLLRMADKIVTVRAVGDTSGNDLAALVARIEGALARGALSDAAAAWDALPDASKQLSAEWGAKLKRRVAADAAARRIADESLSALSAPAR